MDIEEIESASFEIDGLTETEIKELSIVTKRFVRAYAGRDMSDVEGNWLSEQLKAEMPEKTEKEIKDMTNEIMFSVGEFDNNLKDLNDACNKGTSKESWFAQKISEASKGMSVIEYGNYLNGIDNALVQANAKMLQTVTTNAGEISQCMNLDGFIAEQKAVNSFNIEAQLKGSKYFAEVKAPDPGETYGLNSFDVVIKDSSTEKIVHQYQFKYGKDAQATINLLKDGNYNNQRIIVPADQVEEVRKAFPGKTVEAHIGGTDKVSIQSEELTKEQVKQLQKDVQDNGVLPLEDWNAYNTKELAMNIGKNAGLAGLQAAAITTGFHLVEKAVKGEPIDTDEAVEIALETGADAGIKAAATGAVKAGVEKGVISVIPKGTPAGIIANVVCVGIEDAKIMAKVAKGEMTLTEGMDNIGKTTVSMTCGFASVAKGAAIGVKALSWVPVVGPAIGGAVGGMIGYMAGSKVGQVIHEGAKKVRNCIKSGFEKAKSKIKKFGRILKWVTA